MFKSLFTVIASCLLVVTHAQSISRPTSVFEESYGQDGKPMTTKGKLIECSPMFQESWFSGIVQMNKGKVFTDDLFQYNLATQQLFFKKDTSVFAFTEPLLGFSLTKAEKGVEHTYQFKNGYPPIGKFGTNCIYQLLVNGCKVQLLKLQERKAQERYEYNQPIKWVYKDEISWYAYLPATRQIRAVKNNIAAITQTLPEFSTVINRFDVNKKGKKLDEPTLSLLFESLNK